ncbi:NAD-glutamate dehydrogenase [Epidermidibacterium keratini]|uniref:NAD-glutamate dehydrogenase n=1 Tax=Epidermidibacterium keratini TaxID=1891644 RepID=UPI0021F4EE70|nr:NAD-glutamate dehydrogenase [Epidermidibacterium keratini]
MVNPAPTGDVTAQSEARQVAQLVKDAARKIKSDKGTLPRGLSAKDAAAFLERYYADAVEEDLLARTADDLAAGALAHLQAGARRKPHEHAIKVRSTSQSRAVVDIVAEDQPFLVDSVTGEILRRGYAVRFVVHPIIRVARTNSGSLKSVADQGEGVSESWMHFEVIGLDSPDDIEGLREGIESVLRDVTCAVTDWPAMRAQSGQIAAELRTDPPRGLGVAEVDETVEFLDWMADNHFTYLGYREYKLRKIRGRDHLEPVAGTGMGILRENQSRPTPRALPDAAARKAREKRLLILTKASSRATVHRTAYLDYVGVKTFNKKGDVIGERRFVGLLTSTAYRERVENIPVIGQKMTEVIRKAGYEPGSHTAKDLRDVIESFPRDELLQARVDQILPVALAVVRLPERRQTRLFLRRDDYGRFFSALVFLPRDRYSTPVRLKMIDLLMTELGGTSFEYSTQSSESPLARLEFVIRVPAEAAQEDLRPSGLPHCSARSSTRRAPGTTT